MHEVGCYLESPGRAPGSRSSVLASVSLVGSESGLGVAMLALGPTCSGEGDRMAGEILELLILSPLVTAPGAD